ncbi:MAG: hypothetical protein CL816_05260 [Coxiellaceae bacterium]|nr:hypothetical protein [Coxiellaceae bacterium]|tara:strand:- start:1059 stop:1370 length:312 start_codon:yes stop_codon:yes gene_type:complete
MSSFLTNHLNTLWIGIGLLGQVMFSARFLIQWLASERVKQSIVPDLFWYFSLSGGLILLAYAIHKKDPVFILGQGTGILIYSRNLYFIYRQRMMRKGHVATAQ